MMCDMAELPHHKARALRDHSKSSLKQDVAVRLKRLRSEPNSRVLARASAIQFNTAGRRSFLKARFSPHRIDQIGQLRALDA
jgi:archaeosine-15-forming tRNA-guanine transglycosylase